MFLKKAYFVLIITTTLSSCVSDKNDSTHIDEPKKPTQVVSSPTPLLEKKGDIFVHPIQGYYFLPPLIKSFVSYEPSVFLGLSGEDKSRFLSALGLSLFEMNRSDFYKSKLVIPKETWFEVFDKLNYYFQKDPDLHIQAQYAALMLDLYQLGNKDREKTSAFFGIAPQFYYTKVEPFDRFLLPLARILLDMQPLDTSTELQAEIRTQLKDDHLFLSLLSIAQLFFANDLNRKTAWGNLFGSFEKIEPKSREVILNLLANYGLFNLMEKDGVYSDFTKYLTLKETTLVAANFKSDAQALLWKDLQKLVVMLLEGNAEATIAFMNTDTTDLGFMFNLTYKQQNELVKVFNSLNNHTDLFPEAMRIKLGYLYAGIFKKLPLPIINSLNAEQKFNFIDSFLNSYLSTDKKKFSSQDFEKISKGDANLITYLKIRNYATLNELNFQALFDSLHLLPADLQDKVIYHLSDSLHLIHDKDLQIFKKYLHSRKQKSPQQKTDFYDKILANIPSFEDKSAPDMIEKIADGVELWNYQSKQVQRLVLDPKAVHLVIEDANPRYAPLTLEDYLDKRKESYAGTNAGFSVDADDSALSWLLKRFTHSSNYTAKPVGILKTNKNLISDAQNYWSVLGWNNNAGEQLPEVVGQDIKIKWYIQGRNVHLPVHRESYIAGTNTTIIEVRVAGNDSRFLLIYNNTVVLTALKLENIASTFKEVSEKFPQVTGQAKLDTEHLPLNYFTLVADNFDVIEKLRKEKSLQMVPKYITPLNEDGSREDASKSDRFKKMDFMISGMETLVRDDKKNSHPKSLDGRWVQGSEKNKRTVLCFLRDGRWMLSVYLSASLNDLAMEHEALGCQQALNLDSSSQMIIKGAPSDGFSLENRKIFDSLLVVPKGE